MKIQVRKVAWFQTRTKISTKKLEEQPYFAKERRKEQKGKGYLKRRFLSHVGMLWGRRGIIT